MSQVSVTAYWTQMSRVISANPEHFSFDAAAILIFYIRNELLFQSSVFSENLHLYNIASASRVDSASHICLHTMLVLPVVGS